MKHKLIIDEPNEEDIKFLSKDGKTYLNFDDWFDEFLSNTDVIQKLKNIKKEMNNDYKNY